MRLVFVGITAVAALCFAACSGSGKKSAGTETPDSAAVAEAEVVPEENVPLRKLSTGSLALIEWKSLGDPDSVSVFYIDTRGDLWDTNVMRIGRHWRNVADTAAMTAMIPENITDTMRMAVNPELFTPEARLIRANMIPLGELRERAAVAEKRQIDEVIGLIKATLVSSFPNDFFAEPLKGVYGKRTQAGGMDRVYLAVKLPELGSDACVDYSTPIKDFKINGIDFERGKVAYTFKSVLHNDCDGSNYVETTDNEVYVTRQDGRLLIAKSADEGFVILP